MTPKLYQELASWWPLLSPPEEYAEMAAFQLRTLRDACSHEPRTLLELGSGGGHLASHLTTRLQLTLVDLSPEMLELSRGLNPTCEHLEGDMRSVRLGRTFDLVLIYDAIMYMTSETDLLKALKTARTHTAPGGAALFSPDLTAETFRPSTRLGGTDGSDRGIRYLEWTWDPDPTDTTYTVDYAYLLREPGGAARAEHDRHIEGLFPRATWLRLLRLAGFEPARVTCDSGDPDYGVMDVFVGTVPPS